MQDITSSNTRRAASALALLLAINLFNYIDRYILAAIEPLISDHFFAATDDAAMAKTGALATAFLVSYMILAPLFGWLADRPSRWVLVAIGIALWSLASGATGLAQTLNILLLTRCCVGVGEAAYGPVAPTLLSDLYPVERRGQILAFFYLAIPVGSALGYVLGGVIAAHLSWRWAFYLVVPPGLILAFLSWRMPDPPRGAADQARPRKATLADYHALLRNPSYVLDTLGLTAMTFALGGIAAWMPTYIDSLGTAGDLANINFIFGVIVVISGLLATLLGGWAGDALRRHFPGSYFLVCGFGMLLGFPLFLMVLFTPFPTARIFVFLACFCLFFNT